MGQHNVLLLPLSYTLLYEDDQDDKFFLSFLLSFIHHVHVVMPVKDAKSINQEIY